MKDHPIIPHWELPVVAPSQQIPDFAGHASIFAASLLLLFIADRAISLFIPALRDAGGKRSQTRYFLLHVFCNLYVCLVHFDDVLASYSDPVIAYTAPTDSRGVVVILATHVYHILAFRPLPMIDWIHHGVMVLFMLPLAYALQPGPLLGHGAFYSSGLPGMLDYIMLVMIALGFMDRTTEKRINANIHTWLRAPGCLAHVFLSWVCFLDSSTRMVEGESVLVRNLLPAGQFATTFASFVVMITFFWNGMYFQSRVVANQAATEAVARIRVRESAQEGRPAEAGRGKRPSRMSITSEVGVVKGGVAGDSPVGSPGTAKF
eukprot:TRINITY_DN56666_c0_g1_i1.p1 TRINITY_DN56666_c0_g1~~TRINITY_DN56666_c0_g1_i1.p1  ORF type:complete len:319 (+),score=38.33 TRINITY_DN56666_c0_g1_i1:47-1003(+)